MTSPVEHLFRGGGLVPRPLVDPRECWHIYIDAQQGALDKCAQCGAPIQWTPNGSGGWRAVAADSDAVTDVSLARDGVLR